MIPLVDMHPFLHLPIHYTSYVQGKTPLSTTPPVVAFLVSYLAVIFSIQAYMRDKKPLKLTTLFRAHNIILSTGSLVLLVLMLEEIIPIMWGQGFFHAICAKESWTPRLELYYMINYYFKYVELFDTVFLALKKKPLQFLHVFHHSATAYLAYAQLNGKTSMSWLVISLNLAVHVAMYYYYYASAGGARLWWKKYLTTMQIIQFVVDTIVVNFGLYSSVVNEYYQDILPSMGTCAGSGYAASLSSFLLTTYLGLFINFYFRTYNASAKKGKITINGKTNGSLHKED